LDHLTGARDRAALMTALQARLGGIGGVTLLLLDLDGFKQVNDAMGHPAGDRLLRSVADRVRRVLRRDDVLARLGGDEFAILLPEMTDQEAADIGARIVNLLGRPFMLDGQVAHIGASIGCARHPRDASAMSELLRMADLALYSAKEAGRGRMTFASACLREDAEEQIRLEADLRTALALDQFRLLYQPHYDLCSGTLTGFEALLRWHHPKRGLIGPGVFIPIMERSRLIVETGAWLFHQAARGAEEWQRQLGLAAPPGMAINVSAAQFTSGRLAAQVAAALADTATQPSVLELEVTETALLHRSSAAISQLQELKRMGLGVALDDFGTGYSSLSLLHGFAFDRLKIDRSFIAESGRGYAIAASMAQLAASLGMRTTAEGVETPVQLAAARQLGCTDVQGYLTGRPIPMGTAVPTRIDLRSGDPLYPEELLA
jgi:diguanylate cyclase (GGDEF)-like protein